MLLLYDARTTHFARTGNPGTRRRLSVKWEPAFQQVAAVNGVLK